MEERKQPQEQEYKDRLDSDINEHSFEARCIAPEHHDTVNVMKLECGICLTLVIDTLTTECGHQFCKVCWTRGTETQSLRKRCHTCNRPKVKAEALTKINDAISRVNVQCLWPECPWTGERSQWLHHVKSCDFTGQACVWCRKVYLNGVMAQHRRQCDLRMIECDLCALSLRHNKLEVHRTLDCQKRIVVCPDGCGCKLEWCKLDQHQTECPRVQVTCPMRGAGCTWTGARKDLEAHISNKELALTHLQQALQLLEDRSSTATPTVAPTSAPTSAPAPVPATATSTGPQGRVMFVRTAHRTTLQPASTSTDALPAPSKPTADQVWDAVSRTYALFVAQDSSGRWQVGSLVGGSRQGQLPNRERKDECVKVHFYNWPTSSSETIPLWSGRLRPFDYVDASGARRVIHTHRDWNDFFHALVVGSKIDYFCGDAKEWVKATVESKNDSGSLVVKLEGKHQRVVYAIPRTTFVAPAGSLTSLAGYTPTPVANVHMPSVTACRHCGCGVPPDSMFYRESFCSHSCRLRSGASDRKEPQPWERGSGASDRKESQPDESPFVFRGDPVGGGVDMSEWGWSNVAEQRALYESFFGRPRHIWRPRALPEPAAASASATSIPTPASTSTPASTTAPASTPTPTVLAVSSPPVMPFQVAEVD